MRNAAAFMAHIAAIRQIICAKFPYKKLVKECGFIAGSA
jgi:hypothetical protein